MKPFTLLTTRGTPLLRRTPQLTRLYLQQQPLHSRPFTSTLLRRGSKLPSQQTPLLLLLRTRLTQYLPPLLRRLRNRRQYASTKPTETIYNPTPSLGSPSAPLTLSQRMKKLSREYGWSALGVYLLLSALDFPFCFLAVRLLGTDRIGRWEHNLVEGVKSVVRFVAPQLLESKGVVAAAAQGEEALGWGVEEAEERNKSNASEFPSAPLRFFEHLVFGEGKGYASLCC